MDLKIKLSSYLHRKTPMKSAVKPSTSSTSTHAIIAAVIFPGAGKLFVAFNAGS